MKCENQSKSRKVEDIPPKKYPRGTRNCFILVYVLFMYYVLQIYYLLLSDIF